MVDSKFLPYPPPKGYLILRKLWLLKRPWVHVGEHVHFPLQTKVLGTPLEIKTGTVINGPMTVKGSAYVSIGKYCSIAENLYIISSNHRMDRADIEGEFTIPSDVNKGPVYIGNNVWIGDNVMILPGVTIGDGAVIGAGSIVTKNIPAFAVAVANPAKVKKYRFPKNIQKELLNLGWWHWDHRVIVNNKDFFTSELDDRTWPTVLKIINLKDDGEVLNINLEVKNSSEFLLDGWSSHEKGCWTERENVGFILKTNHPDKYSHLSFSAESFHRPQEATFTINGVKNDPITISNSMSTYTIPVRGIKKNINTFRISLNQSFIPAKLQKDSQDLRNLFCRFKFFQLHTKK